LTTDFHRSSDLAYAVAVQPDHKIVVVGTSYTDNDYSNEDFALARYHANGSLDTSFGTNGKVRTNFPNLAAEASAVAIQPDGKILVAGGAFKLLVIYGNFEIARYNPDGSLDTSFGNNGIVTTIFPGQGSFARAIAVQPDGKIIAAGTDYVDFSSEESSNTDFALARYNSDGSPDETFGRGGIVTTDFNTFNDDVSAILLQPNGKIVAVGAAKNAARYYDFALARYLPNGALDVRFGNRGKVRTDFGKADFDAAYAAALQPDGKIVAAGTTISNNGTKQHFALARFTRSGQLDSAFGENGLTTVDFGSFLQNAHSVMIQKNGKIVTVGFPATEESDSDFTLARLHEDGSLDASFGGDGKVRLSFSELNDGANAAVLDADDNIVAVGFTPRRFGPNFALARFHADGK
jgi:uncharacterized delta-60 repeat protein